MRIQPAGRLFAGFVALAGVALAGLPQLGGAHAGEPKTVEATIERAGEDGDIRFFNFHVTIRHDDSTWDHHCDRFEVLDAATGRLQGQLEIVDPFEHEQPFTRMLRLPIEPGVTRVRIRAHDSKHGYETEPLEMDLPVERG